MSEWLRKGASPGNVVTWVLLIVGGFMTIGGIHADIKAFAQFKNKEVPEWQEHIRREIDALKDANSKNRELMLEIRADVRVIREVYERTNGRPAPAQRLSPSAP